MKKFIKYLNLIIGIILLSSILCNSNVYADNSKILVNTKVIDLIEELNDKYENTISKKASALSKLGILEYSVGKYEFTETPTRLEALVILLHMCGEERGVYKVNKVYQFKNLPQWVESYIQYLYTQKPIHEISNNSYLNDKITSKEFCALILRILEYSDEKHEFKCNHSIEYAYNIGLIEDSEITYLKNNPFLRKDIVNIIYNALGTKVKNSNTTLIQKLLNEKVFTQKQIEDIKDIKLAYAAGIYTLKSKKVNFEILYKIHLEGKTSRVEFKTLIPNDYECRQKVNKIEYSMIPTEIFVDGNNKYAKFIIENPNKDFTLSIRCQLQLYKYDLSVAKNFNNNITTSTSNIDSYLKNEKFLEKNSLPIKNTISNFKEVKELDKVEKIYNFVLDTLTYSHYVPNSLGAVQALEHKKGDCTEYTDLFVTLCRANNIPARFIEGYSLGGNRGHDWAEVYLKDYGWVPFDACFQDTDVNNITTFNNLKNVYIYLSSKRNDNILSYERNGETFFRHYYKGSYWGDKIKIYKSIKFN